VARCRHYRSCSGWSARRRASRSSCGQGWLRYCFVVQAALLSAILGLSSLAAPRIGVPTASASASPASRSALFAYASGGDTRAQSCPQTSITSRQCTLAAALSLAVAGNTVALATPGSVARYVGNWSVTTRGTSSSEPLTIEPAPGVDHVVLDGNHGSRQGCSRPACDGPILAIGRDVDVDLEALVFQDANNKEAGGAIDNALGGTVSVTRSVFRHNSAEDAGAIANASFGGTGMLFVTGCTFSANTSQGGGTISGGGAIDNGDSGGNGTVVVSASTFSDNHGVDGGAINNADALGRGVLRVSGATFTGNVAEGSGGAIDNADFKTSYSGPRGTVTVSTSTFSHNRAQGDGGAISSGDRGSVGSLSVSTSTFESNHAGGDGGAIAAGDNFGISPLVVSDSTFWGNSAYHDGGAVASALNGNGPPSPATIVASTFSGNSAAGGGYPNSAAQAISSGDVLWGAADIINGSCSWSTFYDGGYNVVSDATCSDNGHDDVRDRGKDLGPLARNGGPTMTLLPLRGRAATGLIPYRTTERVELDPVEPWTATTLDVCPTTDQRGRRTLTGRPCAAGAVQP
jgi:predicted outer membrane repeat protein